MHHGGNVSWSVAGPVSVVEIVMDTVTSIGHLAAVTAVFITIVQAVTAATAGATSAAGADLLLTMDHDDNGEGSEDPGEDTDKRPAVSESSCLHHTGAGQVSVTSVGDH